MCDVLLRCTAVLTNDCCFSFKALSVSQSVMHRAG